MVSSKAYKGHESDEDNNNFVSEYPSAAGTRLDDCVLCHAGGERPGERVSTPVNACDYCHYLLSAERTLSLTLNSYGVDYLRAGRDRRALEIIRNVDSDGDSYSNQDEIERGFFPGSDSSNPRKEACPIIEVTMAELEAMSVHSQYMLVNSHKQQHDHYVTFTGVRLLDLLSGLEIDPTGATGVTVFSPDGFAKTFSMSELSREYPPGIYYAGLDDAGLGEGRGFVVYPENSIHPGLQTGDVIPGRQYLLLAWKRDFAPMDMSQIDPVSWRIQGEGPFRIVRPQRSPSMPDRGSDYPLQDKYDYQESLDHNAVDMVRGVSIIRIDPMPDRFEEFDAMNAGWSYLESRRIVIYGHGVQRK